MSMFIEVLSTHKVVVNGMPVMKSSPGCNGTLRWLDEECEGWMDLRIEVCIDKQMDWFWNGLLDG